MRCSQRHRYFLHSVAASTNQIDHRNGQPHEHYHPSQCCGLDEAASFPPITPPASAPSAITSATVQLTFPEKMKQIAAALLMQKEMDCLNALSRRE